MSLFLQTLGAVHTLEMRMQTHTHTPISGPNRSTRGRHQSTLALQTQPPARPKLEDLAKLVADEEAGAVVVPDIDVEVWVCLAVGL